MVPALVWWRLVRAVRDRGEGRRESGAFILGVRRKGRAKVKSFVLYDDLDPNALQGGIVVLHSTGFKALWKICRERGLEVIADVHTHGDNHPKQSIIDMENPLIARAGHIALILPRFAGTLGWKFLNVAVCEYIGNYKWRSWSGPNRKRRISFCWW